jgi:hypothetical protein
MMRWLAALSPPFFFFSRGVSTLSPRFAGAISTAASLKRMVAAKSARRLSGWKPESVVSLNDENDDEAERANAANSKREEAEKRQAPSPFREKPGGDTRQAALLDTYAACIKMCTENVRGRPLPAAGPLPPTVARAS